MKKIYLIITLSIIIIAGLFFRFNIFGNDLLWSDEAETTINTMQVLDHGYPSDTYKGKPIYENASYIEIEDPKYALASTNYYGSIFERNKGWLTFYYQAAFIKIFGANTITYRLPFILLFPFSLILLFLLTKKLFSQWAAILASLIYSLNYYAIFYEGQARYYSLTIFLSLFCLYFFYLTITKKNIKYYALSGLGLILLFYTHIVTFLAMMFFLLAVHFLYHRNLKSLFTKKIIILILFQIIFSLPWIITVKFWQVFQVYRNSNFKILWLIFIGILFICCWLLLQYFPKIKYLLNKKFIHAHYLITYLITIILLKPTIAPRESISARLFVESLPIIFTLFAVTIIYIIKKRKVTLFALSAIIMLLLVFYTVSVPFMNPINTYDTIWVQEAINYLDNKKINTDTLILVTYQQLPFLLYTDYNVEVIEPLRKSYIDNYPGPIILFFSKYPIWSKITNGILTNNSIIDVGPRTEKCINNILPDNLQVIECPALVN